MCDSDNKQLNDFDKQYLDYILAKRSKINFLGFLIPINLAIYAAVYFSHGEPFFSSDIKGIPVLLLLLVSIMNIAFSSIYLREERLDEKIKNSIKKGYLELKTNIELRTHIEKLDNEDSSDKGRTFRTTKNLLSLIIVIPIAILTVWCSMYVLNLSKTLNEIGVKLVANPFIWFSVIIFFLWIIVNYLFGYLIKRFSVNQCKLTNQSDMK